jgi:putative transposase
MKRTVSIPIDLNPADYLPLLEQCSEIFNIHAQWSIENKTYNKSKAHASLYEQIKGKYPQIPTAFIQAARDTAMEAVKATKFQRTPKKKRHSGLRFDKRTMALRGDQLSLSGLGKRTKVILQVPDYYRLIFDSWQLKGATLTYSIQTKQFWIRLVYEIETPSIKATGDILGIDRGIRNLAVTSDRQIFSSNTTRAAQRRYLYNRKTAQSKGTRSARKRLKAMSGKEKRFTQDVNHRIAKELVSLDHVKTYVLEDLKGIRNKDRGKKQNKRLSSWPFHQLAFFLTYKAQSLGKEVVYVNARYTSKKCSCCKVIQKENRKKSKYHCRHCNFQLHADWNAAINIKDNYIISSTLKTSEEQAVVIQPYVTISNNQSQAYSLVL